MAIPRKEISKAGKIAGGKVVGFMLSPKNKKKRAANKSLRGANLSLATRAKSPVRSNPKRKAATAPEKPSKEDRPATSRAPPKTRRSKVAESPKIIDFLERWRFLEAISSVKPIIDKAMEKESKPAQKEAATISEVRMGR